MNNRDPIDREPGPERGSVEYGISFENMELMRLSYVEAVPRAAIPIATKLELRYQYHRMTKSLIIEGVIGIAQGESPHVIEEILRTYLQDAKLAEAGKK